MKKDVAIVIPAYNPGKSLEKVTKQLLSAEFENIVVVNDGSKERRTFHSISNNIYLVSHNINCGKGIALKSGFECCQKNFQNIIGIITVDADGQHSIDDVEKMYKELKNTPTSLILGSRNFNQKNIPFKSKIGNTVISRIFENKTGLKLQDTQTGLRAIPIQYIPDLIELEGSRYEYETNMLLYFTNKNIPIIEKTIETIYEKNNKHRHFKAFTDSILICKAIRKWRENMELEGSITSGIGTAKMWVGKIEKVFENKTGVKLFHGTLNIKLEKDYIVKPDWIIKPEEYGGTERVLVKSCKILDNEAYIVRAEKNQKGKGEHNLQIIEIVSNINFRKTYELTDEKKITIQI